MQHFDTSFKPMMPLTLLPMTASTVIPTRL